MYRFAVKAPVPPAAAEGLRRPGATGFACRPPGLGENVSVDSTDLLAWANGQRFVRKGGLLRERYSDPDASWGPHSAVSPPKDGGF